MRHGTMLQRIPAVSKWVQVCGNKTLSLLMYMQEFRCHEFHNIDLVWSAYVSAPPPLPAIWSLSGLWERPWIPILSSPCCSHSGVCPHESYIPQEGESCPEEKNGISGRLRLFHTLSQNSVLRDEDNFIFLRSGFEGKAAFQAIYRNISWDLKLWLHVKKSDHTMNYELILMSHQSGQCIYS